MIQRCMYVVLPVITGVSSHAPVWHTCLVGHSRHVVLQVPKAAAAGWRQQPTVLHALAVTTCSTSTWQMMLVGCLARRTCTFDKMHAQKHPAGQQEPPAQLAGEDMQRHTCSERLTAHQRCC